MRAITRFSIGTGATRKRAIARRQMTAPCVICTPAIHGGRAGSYSGSI
jgi:hypothetical protein